MKDEIKENNSVMKCCICNNENIGEFIVIEDKKYHLNCITNLQEEKDKFKLRCFKALKLIRDNYGILDKYGIDMLDDILNGGSNE